MKKAGRGPWAESQELRICQQALEDDSSMGNNFIERVMSRDVAKKGKRRRSL